MLFFCCSAGSCAPPNAPLYKVLTIRKLDLKATAFHAKICNDKAESLY